MQNERNRKTFEEITEQINRDNTISVNRPIAHAVGAYAAIVFNALTVLFDTHHLFQKMQL